MAILIDSFHNGARGPIRYWHRRCGHLVSDSSLEELHERILKAPGRIQGARGAAAAIAPDAKIESNMSQITKLFASDRLEDVLAALEEKVESVDVYELRISNLERQVATNMVAAAAVDVLLNDLKSDVRILYDRRAKPVNAVPRVPADDVREQYYQYGQGRQ